MKIFKLKPAAVILIAALIFTTSVPNAANARTINSGDAECAIQCSGLCASTMNEYFKCIHKILKKPLKKYKNKHYYNISSFVNARNKANQSISSVDGFEYRVAKDITKNTKKFYKHYAKCIKNAISTIDKISNYKIRATRKDVVKMSYRTALYSLKSLILANKICIEYVNSRGDNTEYYKLRIKEYKEQRNKILKDYKAKKYNKDKNVLVLNVRDL